MFTPEQTKHVYISVLLVNRFIILRIWWSWQQMGRDFNQKLDLPISAKCLIIVSLFWTEGEEPIALNISSYAHKWLISFLVLGPGPGIYSLFQTAAAAAGEIITSYFNILAWNHPWFESVFKCSYIVFTFRF